MAHRVYRLQRSQRSSALAKTDCARRSRHPCRRDYRCRPERRVPVWDKAPAPDTNCAPPRVPSCGKNRAGCVAGGVARCSAARSPDAWLADWIERSDWACRPLMFFMMVQHRQQVADTHEHDVTATFEQHAIIGVMTSLRPFFPRYRCIIRKDDFAIQRQGLCMTFEQIDALSQLPAARRTEQQIDIGRRPEINLAGERL